MSDLNHGFTNATDVSVFCLSENGKVNDDNGMVFYGMPHSPCGTVKLVSGAIEFDLNKVPDNINKFAVTATLDHGTFSGQANIKLNATDFECLLETASRTEKALILLEIYKRNNTWKVRFVGQGFNGGLQPLAELYGVEVANDSPPVEPAVKPINLSKISLTKADPKIDLTKRAGDLGLIKANLNWNQQSGGFFKSKIDLDLGAFVELNNGQREIVQALGNQFEFTPYIKLLADDRTGASRDGEWLHIDGDKIQDVKRIIIFAFIYKGSVNWGEANAEVTLYVPGMPPIETKLTEQDKSKRFCAIAELSVNNSTVKVEQLNRLFNGHKECDQAFCWGFKWKAGSK
jgi:tellurite resistance protein TerA